MSDNARREDNFVTTLLAVSSVDGQSTVDVWADPVTHRLLVDFGVGLSPNAVFLEIPAGTVDGLNTTFTVNNIPLFVDTSGQVNVSDTQDPTNYGFVITGTGPYTLTFVNPPTQTPHSFYNGANGGATLDSFFQTDTFTSTAGQTVFTSSIAPTFVLSFVINDQPQTPTSDYIQSGSTFTLNNPIPAGLPIMITYIHS